MGHDTAHYRYTHGSCGLLDTVLQRILIGIPHPRIVRVSPLLPLGNAMVSFKCGVQNSIGLDLPLLCFWLRKIFL